MRTANNRHYQKGAVLVTVALTLLFLLGFMGIALDFGRLFIIKTELQTAVDSCALAATQELDGSTAGLDRAWRAGITAGNLNRINLQGEDAGLTQADVLFSTTLDGAFTNTPTVDARYARCTRTRTGIAPWLLQAMGAFTGSPAYANNNSVGALGTATRVSAQTNCLIPVGICQKSAANPLGFAPGEWLKGITNSNDEVEANGNFKWIDFPGVAGGTRDIKDLLAGTGQCGLPGSNTVVADPKTGKSNGAVDAWNTRFGIYKGSYSQFTSPPDLTGYAWYEKSDIAPPSKWGQYGKTFQAHRSNHDGYEGDNKPDTDGLKTQGSSSNTDYTKGANRRVATAPVIDCTTNQLKGFACILMLHPMEKNANGKQSKMWLEFISDANAASNNPCVTLGLAGGAGGGLVPALVQ